MIFAATLAAVAVALAAVYALAAARAMRAAAVAIRDHAATLDALARVTAERNAARADARAHDGRAIMFREDAEAAIANARGAHEAAASEREYAAHLYCVSKRLRRALDAACVALGRASGALDEGGRVTMDAALFGPSTRLVAAKNDAAEAAVRARHALTLDADMMDARDAQGVAK